MDRRTLLTKYLGPLTALSVLSGGFWQGLVGLTRKKTGLSPLSDAQVISVIATLGIALLARENLDRTRYESYFRWRFAASLPDRRHYRECASSTVLAFRRHAGFELEQANLPLQQETMRLLVINGRLRHPGLAVVRRQAFQLFRKTDALLLLGYDSFPGQRRGLLTYQEPV